MIRLTVPGLALLTLTLLGLSLHVPGALTVGSPGLKIAFVGALGVSLAVYLLAVAAVLRGPLVRHGVWIVLLVAAAMRLALIPAPAFLSTDIYRYVWDGRVQAAGINPYRYIPADPALESLRDDAVYPHINRAGWAPTIYPPAAQVIFAAIGRIWPGVSGVKAVMVGFECLAVACLLRLLAMAGLPGERVLIYAWNPLTVWDFAGNGHVDAAAIGLMAAALLLRAKRRDAWAGVALGLAVLTKFLPAVIAPVLWRRRLGWRTALAGGAVVIVLYGAYASVGPRVFGFLGGYGSEEGLGNGAGVWLLAGIEQLAPLPTVAAALYGGAAAVLLSALAAWYAFHVRPEGPVALCGAAGVMMAVATCAISPHYPWYFAWLALPCVLAPHPATLWLGSSPVLLYLDTDGDRFFWPSVIYGPAILLAVSGLRLPRAAQPVKEQT